MNSSDIIQDSPPSNNFTSTSLARHALPLTIVGVSAVFGVTWLLSQVITVIAIVLLTSGGLGGLAVLLGQMAKAQQIKATRITSKWLFLLAALTLPLPLNSPQIKQSRFLRLLILAPSLFYLSLYVSD